MKVTRGPKYHAMKVCRDMEISMHSRPRNYMYMSGQFHVPAALILRKEPSVSTVQKWAQSSKYIL